MIALLMLYPGLSAVKLVGTDLVQAVPLVLAAAISNIFLNGLDWSIVVPLVLGSVPGTLIGSKIAPKVPQSIIRRAIVVVLTMSGVALLDKSGWAPLGKEETHPVLIGLVGVAMVVLVPLIWGLLRKEQGLPMFGAPTVAELDRYEYVVSRHTARLQEQQRRDEAAGKLPEEPASSRGSGQERLTDGRASPRPPPPPPTLWSGRQSRRLRPDRPASLPCRLLSTREVPWSSHDTNAHRLPAEPARPAGGRVDPHLP